MKRIRYFFMAGGLAAIAATIALFAVASASNSVIDFEGISEGTIVSSLSHGSGISGDDAGGTVEVFGISGNPGIATNAAMIFDSDCPPGGLPTDCSGGDLDLGTPNELFGGPGVSEDGSGPSNEFPLGNILIISEDLDSSDPDDADLTGAFFTFDFSNWGPGVVTVNSIELIDVEPEENDAKVELFFMGGLLDTISIGSIGDNGVATLFVGVSGVDFMRVTLNGSGAIDNIDISTEDDEMVNARITGGGHQIGFDSDAGRVRVTKGFTLHCDITLSNNLEINWPGGNNWHIEKLVDDALCYDNPNFEPNPPTAPADTYVGVDVGKLNGVDGSYACWLFEDHGEPGSSDKGLIQVFAVGDVPVVDLTADPTVEPPCSGATPVMVVPFAEITGGNLQFHEDQPHK